jgi:hypothetical protein
MRYWLISNLICLVLLCSCSSSRSGETKSLHIERKLRNFTVSELQPDAHLWLTTQKKCKGNCFKVSQVKEQELLPTDGIGTELRVLEILERTADSALVRVRDVAILNGCNSVAFDCVLKLRNGEFLLRADGRSLQETP